MSDLNQMGQEAKQASFFLNKATTKQKNEALEAIFLGLKQDTPQILEANKQDILKAKDNKILDTMIDRLKLTKERLDVMQEDIKTIISLEDPIGKVDNMWKQEDNLLIGKQQVPLGVIGMIYESRPNVTTDATALALKSGNAIILRGGKEAIFSNIALVKSMQASLERVGFPKYAVQLIEDTSRAIAAEFMQLTDYLDVLIPRGGANLIKTVVQTATVPVIETGVGNCHIYVDKQAQLDMAISILLNGKTQRPSVCNATETLLVHQDIAKDFLTTAEPILTDKRVALRADKESQQYLTAATLATEADFKTEYNDLILAVKIVKNLDEAISHINYYGTKHSEVIVTDSYQHSQKFMQEVDAAVVYVNASSRFTDGSKFGFGGEIGISTQKIHARGPMGLNELTTSKYVVFGEGQVRS